MSENAAAVPEKVAQPEEEVDIDLNDPEVAKAASKIQGVFRGKFGRKKEASTPAAAPEAESK